MVNASLHRKQALRKTAGAMRGCSSCRPIRLTLIPLKKHGLISKEGCVIVIPILILLKMPSTFSFSSLLLNNYMGREILETGVLCGTVGKHGD
jgi:hypothetical protein